MYKTYPYKDWVPVEMLQMPVFLASDASAYMTASTLIVWLHQWLRATDGTGSTVRTALLDFRKAFDLVNHHILVAKLLSLGVKPSVVNWIIDFLRGRQQRVKLNGVFSDWLDVSAGVPQGTRLGPWLFLAMINDLRLPEGFHMWKFADDTTVSEVVPPSKAQHSTTSG